MNRRRFVAMIMAGGVGVVTFRPASAGGWATVELAKPVGPVVAGELTLLQFRVLAHGNPVTPIDGMQPIVMMVNRETGEDEVFDADPRLDDPFLYEAELLVSEAGSYKWEVIPDPYPPVALAPITVSTKGETGDVAATPEISGDDVDTEILDMSFADSVLDVPVGTTVRWTNTSAIPHQVVFRDLSIDDSAMLHEGDEFRVTFTERGEFGYYCGPHPSMTGVVYVG